MSHLQVFEGTLDEISTRYGQELSGLRVRVTVDESFVSEDGMLKPLYETATPEQWIEALRSWAASHDPNKPLLSDEATDRERIYEGRDE